MEGSEQMTVTWPGGSLDPSDHCVNRLWGRGGGGSPVRIPCNIFGRQLRPMPWQGQRMEGSGKTPTFSPALLCALAAV